MLTITFCITGFASIQAFADEQYETEPNDNKEIAEEIQANNEKPQDMPSGDYSNQHVTKGTTSSSDEDWFKVLLPAGPQVMTCNDKSFAYTIYSSDDTVIASRNYISNTGAQAFSLNIPSNGYYYVRVIGFSEEDTKYLFAIGSPTYRLDVITTAAKEGSITLNETNPTRTATFDLSGNTTLPEDAIVYAIKMNGVTTTAASEINIVYDPRTSVSLQRYVWSKEGLASLNMKAKHTWTAKFTYQKDITFQPQLLLRYVYPLKPTN